MEAAGADRIHVDVMDNHFVPNLTLGPPIVKAVRKHSKLPFDVHLMAAPVERLLPEFADAGADSLTVHPEAGPHLHRSLQIIKELGLKAGIALNPATPPEIVAPVIGGIDSVLVMSVNPGFGGQGFIASSLEKIATLRRMIAASGRRIDLEVDGGVNLETIGPIVAAGADVLVAGTASFKGGPEAYAGNIEALRARGQPETTAVPEPVP